jgi:adenosylcobinamide amidohydrolase
MLLCNLSTGDPVERDDRLITVRFREPRKVLSTSVLNGGYREDLVLAFNYDCSKGEVDRYCCKLRGKTYEEHMRLEVKDVGLDPNKVTGMLTAAQMKNAAVSTVGYKGLNVTAIVTAGVEVNAGRAGDPAEHFNPVDKNALPKIGTINIILVIDADLPAGIMARALVTCTEAKTAALQELMVGSNYSNGLATGTGTDQTIIIANPSSPIYLESAGKHSKLGELIGKAVKGATKEALLKQNNLSPQKQHSILRRMKRFGANEEVLWEEFVKVVGLKKEDEQMKLRQKFADALSKIEKDPAMVTYTSLYVHLIDQFIWGLLSSEEVVEAGGKILSSMAEKFTSLQATVEGEKLEDYLKAWMNVVVEILKVGIDGK